MRHHLIDVAGPDGVLRRRPVLREGRTVLAELHRRGVPPLVVGGTGLYLKALLHGLFEEGGAPAGPPGAPAPGVARSGLPRLYLRLAALDPATPARLHPHDTYRILGPWR